MITKTIQLATIGATILFLAAGTAQADIVSIYRATLAEPNQKTQEVSTDDMRRILADTSAVVIDTRTREEFDAGHIPGARNPSASNGTQVAAVQAFVNGNKAAPLVLYCNGPYCRASRRLAEQLVDAGFTNVRRYQLGMPVWRALGGPTQIEIGGIARVYKADRTAVFIDGRSTEEFKTGSLEGARNAPADDVASGKLKKIPLPEDDFNRRIILFGRNGAQAKALAKVLSKRPWHNVNYYAGSFETLADALKSK